MRGDECAKPDGPKAKQGEGRFGRHAKENGNRQHQYDGHQEKWQEAGDDLAHRSRLEPRPTACLFAGSVLIPIQRLDPVLGG